MAKDGIGIKGKNLWGFTEKIVFLGGGGSQKNQYLWGDCLKRGLDSV